MKRSNSQIDVEEAFTKKLKAKDEELNVLNREIRVKNNEMTLKCGEFNTMKQKVRRQNLLIQKLKDKLECPVCLDIPRNAPVPVCLNGHFVCQKCKRDSCPSCRIVMGVGTSLLAATILENIEHTCKFVDCDKVLAREDLENHEEGCAHRIISCPHVTCEGKFSLAKLVDHFQSSPCCMNVDEPLPTKEMWHIKVYTGWNENVKQQHWPIHMLSYAGEHFAVLPFKSEGLVYFMIVMLASESKCSKFKFEMIVHDRWSNAFNSTITVKFTGTPLSIDVKKEDLKLYGPNEHLMKTILGPINAINNQKGFGLS